MDGVTEIRELSYPGMLNETKIRAAKPREKPYKLFDERGLFLAVKSLLSV
jgi:hypothetical protein